MVLVHPLTYAMRSWATESNRTDGRASVRRAGDGQISGERMRRQLKFRVPRPIMFVSNRLRDGRSGGKVYNETAIDGLARQVPTDQGGLKMNRYIKSPFAALLMVLSAAH